MRTNSTIIALLLAATVMLPLAGCGDNDNNNNFNDNGNDNGSVATRTPTPVRTVTPIPPTATPVSPDETATPTEAAATPTPTTAGPVATATTGGTPVPTSTPAGGAACVTGEHIVVSASLDKPFAAFAMTLGYPVDSVNIPGSGAAVGNRVVFNVTGGLSTASDDDDSGDGSVDDTLHASFVSGTDNAAGKVFTVTFDCVAGQAKPAAGSFTCTVVSASTSGADTIPDEVCTLDVR